MRFSNEEVLDELDNVDTKFDFSGNCSNDLEEYLIEEGLVDFIDGVPVITYSGQAMLGYSKEDLKDMYGDENTYE